MMTKPKISIVVALGAKTRAIGNGPNLLWRISDDLKRVKSLTLGHPIIMGRKTFESIGKPLPDRTNIVVTRNATFKAEGVIICRSIEEAIDRAIEIENSSIDPAENKEIFIFGGGEIYAQSINKADRLYLTLVESDLEGDVFFPDYSMFYREISKEYRLDEKTGLRYSWVTLEK